MEHIDTQSRCFFTQQVFLIGTCNEDGTAHFAPISWISYTAGSPACLVISMAGNKVTKENLQRTGLLSATVATPDMLSFLEQCNAATRTKDVSGEPPIDVEKGAVLNVPLIRDASFSYECRIIQTVLIGQTHTYFAEIKSINCTEAVKGMDFLDLRAINPLIYSPMNYFTVGTHLGRIGDFSKQ